MSLSTRSLAWVYRKRGRRRGVSGCGGQGGWGRRVRRKIIVEEGHQVWLWVSSRNRAYPDLAPCSSRPSLLVRSNIVREEGNKEPTVRDRRRSRVRCVRGGGSTCCQR